MTIFRGKKYLVFEKYPEYQSGGGHKKAAGFQVQDIRTIFSFI